MTEPKVRVVRILVYEGTPAFIRNSLAQRQVKEKFRTMDGTITEGYLSGDVGNTTFVKPEEAELIDHPFCTPVYPADGGRES